MELSQQQIIRAKQVIANTSSLVNGSTLQMKGRSLNTVFGIRMAKALGVDYATVKNNKNFWQNIAKQLM